MQPPAGIRIFDFGNPSLDFSHYSCISCIIAWLCEAVWLLFLRACVRVASSDAESWNVLRCGEDLFLWALGEAALVRAAAARVRRVSRARWRPRGVVLRDPRPALMDSPMPSRS
jgi:hypothetical protein